MRGSMRGRVAPPPPWGLGCAARGSRLRCQCTRSGPDKQHERVSALQCTDWRAEREPPPELHEQGTKKGEHHEVGGA